MTTSSEPAFQSRFHSRSGFQHRPDSDSETCACPIHREYGDRQPFTAPFGLPFADHVTVHPIDQATAREIYAAHHGYMRDLPNINLCHHGVYYQGQLLGAITYRYPLISRKALRFDADGHLIPEPMTEDGIEADLPEPLHDRAKRLIPLVDESDVARREVISGDGIVEAARICLGARMPNLASAGLARSQEQFLRDYGHRDVRVLLTWVRADYDGSMVRALRDKGWTCTGYREPGQAGNRDEKPIRERYKWRFLCPVEVVTVQASLGVSTTNN